MPFPLAHPAAVLPLIRWPFVASALVAGAVAPDFLYVDAVYRFATQHINGNFTLTLTHKFSSVFWLDPLLALLALLLFHLIIKRPLLALAPPDLAGRLPSPAERLPAPTRYAVLGAAVLFGVAGAVFQVTQQEEPLVGEAVVRLTLTGLAVGALIAVAAYVLIWQLTQPQRLRRSRVSTL
jgi:hypothetical protein